MKDEAKLEQGESGLVPSGDGWFVVNVADAAWVKNERFGWRCSFEGEARFPDFGVGVHVVQPGQPNCFYHREAKQEGMLVLSGECTLLVEGEERPLKQWDYFHCAVETEHVIVGAGDGPCAILFIGGRGGDQGLFYPAEPVAQKHGASAEAATANPREAYAAVPPSESKRGAPWPPA